MQAGSSMTPRPYLVDVAGELWPGTHDPKARRFRSVDGRTTFLALPRTGAPSMLIPRTRAAAAGAVRAYGGHGSRLNRVKTQVTSALLAVGLGGVLFPGRIVAGPVEESITAELARILGVPVEVAARGGPPRANRKPVLAVLSTQGTPLAFAKLGTTPLADRLVRAEAEALGRLSGVRTQGVRVPRLIHFGTWRGMVLLVQEALPVHHSRPAGDAALRRAMCEIAGALGTTTGSWGNSAHAAAVREQLGAMGESPAVSCLTAAADALAVQDVTLPLGSWHGDWTPWNCSATDGAVLVWDWERFAAFGVPIGFDDLHYSLQTSLAQTRAPSTKQPAALMADAAKRLAPLDLTPAQAHLIAVAYLIEIAVRYLSDDQAAAGARVGDVDSWLLPVITQAAAGLPSPREKSAS
jgi:hypothetical protein